MPSSTLCVGPGTAGSNADAERPGRHSHAERGNEEQDRAGNDDPTAFSSAFPFSSSSIVLRLSAPPNSSDTTRPETPPHARHVALPVSGPRGARPPEEPLPGRQAGRRGVVLGDAQEPAPGVLGRVRRAPGVHPGRRPQAHRLARLRPERQALHQAVRGRDEPELLPAARHVGLDGLQVGRGAHEAGVRLLPRGESRLPDGLPARRGRPDVVRHRRPRPRPRPAGAGAPADA